MRKADATAADVNERSVNRILHGAMRTGQFYLYGKWHGNADEMTHLDAFDRCGFFNEPDSFGQGGAAAESGMEMVDTACAGDSTLEIGIGRRTGQEGLRGDIKGNG